MVDLRPLLDRQHGPGGPVHAAETRQVLVAILAVQPRRLVDHQEVVRGGAYGLQQAKLSVGLQVMNRQTAPRRIGRLGAAGQSLDEVAMVELDLVSHAREVLRRELEPGLERSTLW
jgi:hypothetical protein